MMDEIDFMLDAWRKSEGIDTVVKEKWVKRVRHWESFLEGLYHKCVSVPNGGSYVRPYEWKKKESI
jgi:hypothetical protein